MRGLLVLGALVSVLLISLLLARPFLAAYVYYWLAFMVPLHISYSVGSGIAWSQIVVAIMFAAILISRDKINRQVFKDPAIVFMTLLFTWTGVTTLTARFPDAAQIEFMDNIKIWLMTIFCASLMTSRERLNYLVWILVISIGFHTVQAGIITVGSGGNARIYGPESSPFNTENPFARVTIMIFPLILFLFYHSKHTLVRKGLVGASLLDVIALVGTGSRGGFLAFCGMASYMWLRSSRKFALAFVVAIGAGAGAILLSDGRLEKWTDRMSTIGQADEVYTAQQRFESWIWALDYAAAHPIVGGGYGVFMLNTEHQGKSVGYLLAHSNYFQMLGEHGYVGLSLYLLMLTAMFSICRKVERASRNRPEVYWERDLAIALKIAAVGYMIGGITITHEFYELFYVYVGMVAATRALVIQKIGIEAYSNPAKHSGALPNNGQSEKPKPSSVPGRSPQPVGVRGAAAPVYGRGSSAIYPLANRQRR